MKSIKIALILLSTLSSYSAISQVIANNSEVFLGSENIASVASHHNKSSNRNNEQSTTHMAVSNIRNNTKNEAMLIGLEKPDINENSISYTDLTLIENSLKIHQVKNKNRLIRIKDVQFVDEVTFYNHLGYLVNTISSVTPKESSVVLNLNTLKEGIYFIKFKKHNTIKRIRVY